MNTETALQQARELLAAWAKETKTPESKRLDVSIAVSDLYAAVRALDEARWGYLSAITGLDPGSASGELEVLYHFCRDAAVATLRMRIPRAEAQVPSVCEIIPSASFFEHELSEMFGVTIVGAQYPEHLYLPEDWPPGIYPLRKDFQRAKT